jgi:hypothetical protein
MLRAAAVAAWLILPYFGYFLGILFQDSESADGKGSGAIRWSSSSTRSSRSSSARMPMIYSSKSALPSEWDKRQVMHPSCHAAASKCFAISQPGVGSVACRQTQQLQCPLHQHAVGQRSRQLQHAQPVDADTVLC